MEFRVLGELEVCDRGEPLVIGTPRIRAVLGVLLLHPNQVVSVDLLVDELWPQQPPQKARALVHDYVSRLRRALRPVATDHGEAPRLITHKPGYRLRVGEQELDREQFEHRLIDARAVFRAGQLDRCLGLYDEAERLWRGAPFADVPHTPSISAAVTSLNELRLTSLEERYEVALETGAAAGMVAELTELVTRYPQRERLVSHLMVALHRAGRGADALETYRQTKQRLVNELGIDPGPMLQQLERAILRNDPTLAAPTRSGIRVAPAVEPPAQLPADLATFTGRAAELARLLTADRADGQPAAVVLGAIDGMAGVGKTALAVHAAHRLAERCPDGQLFIDLHGFTPGVAPVESGEALDRLLRGLGVESGERTPADVDDRAGLWRSTLAGRRMVIVLDNAASEAQVEPLLPGAAGCLVLVTSRRRLAGLEAAHTVSLDMLPPADALTLFTRCAGMGRFAQQPRELIAETVELCGRLPLAVRVAAARLRSHPAWGVADMVERLRDQDQRLAELGDGPRGVAAALDLSYQQLSSDQQRMYRLLGLHPGPDIAPHAAAALARTSLVRARRLLDQLLDAHLLQEPAVDRYMQHDLVRAHATDAAIVQKLETERRAALTRLLDHYRHTASMAMDVAYPYERERRPHVPPPDGPTPDLPDPTKALAWLDIELPNLLAAAQRAAGHGWPEHIQHLSAILHRHLRTRGRYHDAATLHDLALATARTTGNHANELAALTSIGDISALQGRYQPAIDYYQPALQIARNSNNRAGELAALLGLGHVHHLQGWHEQAIDHYQSALEIARNTGNRVAELDALTSLGNVHQAQSRLEQAIGHYRPALEIARNTGNHIAELIALTCLGGVHRLCGRFEQAIDHYQPALHIARAIGHRAGELNALNGLGRIRRLQGCLQQAIDTFVPALEIARTTGNRVGEQIGLIGLGHVWLAQGQHEQAANAYAKVLHLAREAGDRNWQYEAVQGLGRLHLTTGNPHAAILHHRQALRLAIELAQPADKARAHDGLAHAHQALNQPVKAREHWQQALNILTSIGTDYTDDKETDAPTIRAHLAGRASPRRPWP